MMRVLRLTTCQSAICVFHKLWKMCPWQTFEAEKFRAALPFSFGMGTNL